MDQRPTDPAPGRPAEGLEVAVEPLVRAGARRTRRGLLLIGVSFAVILGVLVGLAQAFPPQRSALVEPSAIASDRPTATPSTGPASPDGGGPGAFPRRYRPADLVARVLDGRLDGYVVYADARLRRSCPSERATDCTPTTLAVEGLGLDVVAADSAGRGVAEVPARALLVLLVRGGRLEYLGSLIAAPDGSPPLDSIAPSGAAPDTAAARQTLHDTSGWLVVDPRCASPAGARALPCPPQEAFLAADQPQGADPIGSARGQVVALAPDPWGIDPVPGAIIEGPFIVTTGPAGGPAWEVLARYEPARSVRVVVP